MYRAPYEVELQKTVDVVLECFESAYEKRYGARPYTAASEHSVLSWMIQKWGKEKAIELVESYVRMNDDWFLKKAHALSALKENVNKVLIHSGARASNKISGHKISSELHCDSCWIKFSANYSSQTDLEKVFIRCPICLSMNAPFKYPTKKEFEKNWSCFNKLSSNPFSYESIFKDKKPHPDMPNLLCEVISFEEQCPF